MHSPLETAQSYKSNDDRAYSELLEQRLENPVK